MNQREAYVLARETMNEHGLEDWSFGFDNAVKRLGVCRINRKRIQLSKTFVAMNGKLKVYDVILHEVAHALCSPWAGHGVEWKRKALEIGCTEAKSRTTAVSPPPRYLTKCPNGHTGSANRRPRQPRSCGRCSNRYNPDYHITYSVNPEYGNMLASS